MFTAMTRVWFVSATFISLVVLSAGAQVLPAPDQQGAARPAPSVTTVIAAGTIQGTNADPQFATTTNTQRETETAADGSLRVHKVRDGVDFFATVGSGVRRYPKVINGSLWAHAFSSGLDARLSPKITLNVTGGAGYSHFVLPGVPSGTSESAAAVTAPGRAGDFGFLGRPTATYDGGTRVSDALTTRSSLILSYDAVRTATTQGPSSRTLDQRAQLGFENRFRRRAALQVAYAYRDATYDAPGLPSQSLQLHSATFGIDRQWVHSPTRQTLVRASVSPSTALSQFGTSRYFTAAKASLDSQISRTWLLSVGGARDFNFLNGIAQPLLLTSAQAEARGRLGSRVELMLIGVAARSGSGFNTAASSYRSTGGSARLGWDVIHAMSLFGEYLYTRYTVSDVLQFGAIGPPRADRSSFRAGLTWRVPLRGGRAINAAR